MPPRARSRPAPGPCRSRRRTPGALSDLATAVGEAITPETQLADVARTLATGRAHLAMRAVVRADSPAAAKAGFKAVAKGLEAPGVVRGRREVRDPPRIAFLFTGQGAQYAGMGAAPLRNSAGFPRRLR